MKGRWIGLLSLLAACSSRGGSFGLVLEGGATSDVSAALDTGTRPDDTGTPIEDAGTPPTDTGTPPVDTGPMTGCTIDSECSALGLVCDRVLNRCVECIADADCVRGRFCPPSHVCAVQVCSPGESSCLGTNRQSVCDSRGSAQVETACASGETCRTGRCQPAACTPGSATCDEATGQRRVCNAEGSGTSLVACPSGQRCRDNVCAALACTPNSRTCVGTTSLRTCNSAGTEATTTACPPMPNATGACAASACGFFCSEGFGNCDNTFSNGCETAFASSSAHCGACGRACASGQTCSGGSCVTGGATGNFRVTSFGTTGCMTVEHKSISGDDHGGIAVTNDYVFLNGDSACMRATTSLAARVPIGSTHDSMFSDLATGQLYAFVTATSNEVSLATPSTATRLGHLSDVGLLTPMTALSSPIVFNNGTQYPLFFAGYGQVVVYSGSATSAPGNWYSVALPSGTVRLLGSFLMPTYHACEVGGAWGVAESVGGEVSVVYVESSTALGRLRLSTQAVTRIPFTNLGDACSITMSPFLNRWYLHSEQPTQFSAQSETLTYCAAGWTVFAP